MAFLIGTDEAGYGPNLGPLVITATVWHVPDELAKDDLYEWLDGVVSRERARRSDPTSIPIADSKTLYKPRGKLDALEYGVFTALAATGIRVASWREAWQAFAPSSEISIAAIPWYNTFNRELPVDADSEQAERLTERFRQRLGEIAVHLVAIRSIAIFPESFNDLVDQTGSKGAVLSGLTIDLIEELLTPLGDEAILVQCDKHGGRNKYGPLLQNAFPDHLVEIHGEGRAQSIYRWGPRDRRVEARFVAKGESFLPSALASMVCKYLRELAMMAFNQFWRERVPDLKPTAGYPADARRFRADIAACQAQLQIPDRVLWRNR